MKIVCVSNKKDLEANQDIHIGLEIGKIYQVYGLIIIDGTLNFYICDKLHQDFPVFYRASLFHVIDHRLSRFWIYSCIQAEKSFPAFLFPEAFSDEYFFDKLTDGNELEISIFKKYKELMDLEFSDLTISQIAQLGDENWLICPDCIEGWDNASSIDALVRCPKCLKVFNNPRRINIQTKVSI